ncbi:MAG: hypothetical protein CfClM3_0091 [Methanobrevibacter sp. CfCl-M3]
MKIGEIIDKIKEIDVKEIEFKKIHVILLIVGLVLVFGALPAYNFVMDQTGADIVLVNTTSTDNYTNKINVSKIQLPIGTGGKCNFGFKSLDKTWYITYMDGTNVYLFSSADMNLYNKLKNNSAISITNIYNNAEFGYEDFELTKDIEITYTVRISNTNQGATGFQCSIRDFKIIGQ